MKTVYKGFEIDVYREKALGGWDNVYYGVHRISDGWELTSGFYDGSNTVRGVVDDMKKLLIRMRRTLECGMIFDMKILHYYVTDDISAIIDFNGDIYNIIYDGTVEYGGYKFDFYVRDGMLSIYEDGHPILICGTCKSRTQVLYGVNTRHR